MFGTRRYRLIPLPVVVLLPSELIPNKASEVDGVQTPAQPENIEVERATGPRNEKVTPTSVV